MDERVVKLEAKVQNLKKIIQKIKVYVWQKFEEEIPQEILGVSKEECDEEPPTKIVKTEPDNIIVHVPTLTGQDHDPEDCLTSQNPPNLVFIDPDDPDFNDGDFDEPLDYFEDPIVDDLEGNDNVNSENVQIPSQLNQKTQDLDYIERLCIGKTESLANLIRNCFKTSLIIKLERLLTSDIVFKRIPLPRASKIPKKRTTENLKRSILCPTMKCPKKMNKFEVEPHLKKFHPEFIIQHVCKFCPRIFRNHSNLSAHLRRFHTKESSYRYKCFICQTGFELFFFYKKHMDAHTHELKYQHLVQDIAQELKKLEDEEKSRIKSKSKEKVPKSSEKVPKSKEKVPKLNLNPKLHSKDGLYHTCHICYKLLGLGYNNISEHFEQFHPDQCLKCGICSEIFYNRNGQIKHEREKHPEKFKHTCSICSNVFKVKGRYFRHLKIIHGVTPDSSGNLQGQSGLKPWVKPKKKQSSKPHVKINSICPICGKSMWSYKLKSHILYTHEKPGSFICSFEGCGMAFNKIQYVKKHESWTHKSKEEKEKERETRRIACSTCGVLVDPPNMDRHILLKHNKEKQKIICGIEGCQRTFAFRYILWEHYRVHMNQKRPEYSEEFTRNCPEEVKKFLEKRRESVKKYATKYNAKKKEEKCLEKKKSRKSRVSESSSDEN